MQTKRTYLIPLLPFFSLFFLILSEHMDTNFGGGSRDIYLSFVILQILTFLLPTIFFCKAKGDNYIFRLKLHLFGLEKGVFVVAAAVVLVTLMTSTEMLLQSVGITEGVYSHTEYSLYGRTIPDVGVNIYDTLYTLIVYAILPAVTEEFLFRSVLYTEYERYGAPAAILLTAFLYGLFSMNPVSMLPMFMEGLVLGFAVYVTDSVFAPLLMHIAYNLYSLFLEEYIWAFVAKPENAVFLTYAFVTLLLLSGVLMFNQAERVAYDKGMNDAGKPFYLKTKRSRKQVGIRGFFRAFNSPFYLGCILLFFLKILDLL